jgi:hypothetical protein
MNWVVQMYGYYLIISILVTVWVARTLFKNGRIFLLDAFDGNAPLADSVNHLLVVGFYLINIGYVTMVLQNGDHPDSLQRLLETLSTKIGVVLLILGGMHFFNMAVFAKMRRAALNRKNPHPITPMPVVGHATFE